MVAEALAELVIRLTAAVFHTEGPAWDRPGAHIIWLNYYLLVV